MPSIFYKGTEYKTDGITLDLSKQGIEDISEIKGLEKLTPASR